MVAVRQQKWAWPATNKLRLCREISAKYAQYKLEKLCYPSEHKLYGNSVTIQAKNWHTSFSCNGKHSNTV